MVGGGAVTDKGISAIECGDGGGVSIGWLHRWLVGIGATESPSEYDGWLVTGSIVGFAVCARVGFVDGAAEGSLAKRPGGSVGYFGTTGVKGIQATESVLRHRLVSGQ